MPSKKNRSRYGNNNSSASSQTTNLKIQQQQPHPINNLNTINGIANGNHNNTNVNNQFNGNHSTYHTNNTNPNNHTNNQYHHPNQVKSASYSLATPTPYPTINGNIGAGNITFTPKQQQQLDRNAFLLTLTKDQLKVECRKRGQKTTGTKTELVFFCLRN